jgi:hypothetical protein
MKPEIIAQLGQTDILLPSLIAEGLSANDRVKAHLSVLQATGRHARSPSDAMFDLGAECRSTGLDPAAMKSLVNRAGLLAGECVTAPGLDLLRTAIWDDVTTTLSSEPSTARRRGYRTAARSVARGAQRNLALRSTPMSGLKDQTGPQGCAQFS